jgi:hypothetical protein
MPRSITLSEDALALFRLHVERDGIRVDDANREAHRELARAGLMDPVSGFTRGPEAYYRFTEEGWTRREELLNARTAAPPAGSP